MSKLEKGDNSSKYLQTFAKILSGHLHLGYKLYATYHNPSQAILQIFCSHASLCVENISVKRGKIQSNIHRIQ